MRTISLTEYETRTEALSERELERVLATRIVSVSPRADGLYDLRPESTVGTVVYPELRLLIRPKVGLPNVFFLLAYGAGLTDWREESFPYAEDEFFHAIAWLLEAEIRRATRHGLVRDYREREEPLPTVRGRIDLAAQVRRRQDRLIPLDCRYQEYSEDIDLNRILKAALQRLLRLPLLDRELTANLRHHHRLLEGVSDIDIAPAAVPALTFTRLNETWRPAARLAQLLLRADSVRDLTGAVDAVSFTVDMNLLFERFIETVVREESRQAGWELDVQARRRFSESVQMRPDVVLRRGGIDRAVGTRNTSAWPPPTGHTRTSTRYLRTACRSTWLAASSYMQTRSARAARRSGRPVSPWK